MGGEFKSEQQNNELNENFIKNNIMAEDLNDQISEIKREDKGTSNKLSSDLGLSNFINGPIPISPTGRHPNFKSDTCTLNKQTRHHNRICSNNNNIK